MSSECLWFIGGFPDSSVGKESACNPGDPGSDSQVGKIPWRRDRLPTPVFLGFCHGLAGRESACNAADWDQSLGWADPLKKERIPTPVSWPREFHGQHSPWGLKELDMTE